MRERERGLEEGGGGNGRAPQDAGAEREAQRRGDGCALRLVHRGVQQRDAREKLRMIDRPPKRHHPAPVVPERDDGPLEGERVGEIAEVAHASGERTERARALGETHVELVDGDNPPGRAAGTRSLHRLVRERSPEVRPGGVAVYTEDGADRLHAECGEQLTGVEQMPGVARSRFGRIG